MERSGHILSAGQRFYCLKLHFSDAWFWVGPATNTGPAAFWRRAFFPAVLPLYWPPVTLVWGLSQKKPDHVQICLHSCCTGLNRLTGEDVLNYRPGSGLGGLLILFGSKRKREALCWACLVLSFGLYLTTHPPLPLTPEVVFFVLYQCHISSWSCSSFVCFILSLSFILCT